MSTRFRYLPAVLFSLLFLPLVSSCEFDGGEELQTGEQVTPIAGYRVEPRDLSRTVRVSSRVEPERTVTISSRMDGLVTSLHAREGDRMDRGDLLLELDVEEQRAELERARAQLELAEARYQRNRQLLEREAISAAEYDESRAEMRMASSEVSLLETRLSFGTVSANGNQVVLERFVEEGDAVSALEPLFRVAAPGSLVIRVGVSERDVVHIDEGDPARFRIDAFSDRVFQGTVQRIYPAADPDSRLVTVEIGFDAGQHEERIRPGYLARVEMAAERRDGILAIPSEALLASDRQDRFVFLINEEDRLERRPVETGIERRNWTEILDGLEPGEVIVGGNPGNLREELLVRVTRWVDDESPETAQR